MKTCEPPQETRMTTPFPVINERILRTSTNTSHNKGNTKNAEWATTWNRLIPVFVCFVFVSIFLTLALFALKCEQPEFFVLNSLSSTWLVNIVRPSLQAQHVCISYIVRQIRKGVSTISLLYLTMLKYCNILEGFLKETCLYL